MSASVEASRSRKSHVLRGCEHGPADSLCMWVIHGAYFLSGRDVDAARGIMRGAACAQPQGGFKASVRRERPSRAPFAVTACRSSAAKRESAAYFRRRPKASAGGAPRIAAAQQVDVASIYFEQHRAIWPACAISTAGDDRLTSGAGQSNRPPRRAAWRTRIDRRQAPSAAQSGGSGWPRAGRALGRSSPAAVSSGSPGTAR